MTTKRSKGSAEPGSQPARWAAAPPRNTTATTERLIALFRAGETAKGLTGAEHARIWSRLTTAVSPSFRWRGLAGLRWVIAVAVLLTSGAVIGAVTAHRWWPVPERAASPGDERMPMIKSRPPRRARSGPTTTVDPPATEPAPAVETTLAPSPEENAPTPTATSPTAAPPTAPPSIAPAPPLPHVSPTAGPPLRRSVDLALRAPVTATRPAPSPVLPAHAPPPEPVPSTLSGETQVLGQAMARLRRQGDAAGALAALDLYRQRFPRGTLQREADVARVDALLTLGQDGNALAVLRTLSLQPRGHDQELRVIRGELTAATSCPRALVDFDTVLAESAPPALMERALYGRAACRAKQGDDAGAARDLREYLRRFPSGQFAADARRSTGNK